MNNVVIYIGGDGPEQAPDFVDPDLIIAADSGLDLAFAHEITPNIIVGDLDSVLAESLNRAQSLGIEIRRFNSDKDKTDLELAIDIANESECDHLIIVGGGGQRTDHLLANISVLAGEQTSKFIVDAFFGDCRVSLCRPDQPRNFLVEPSTSLSLIPIGGDVKQVNTHGLKWELSDSTLNHFQARGISNICIEKEVHITVSEGNLAIII